MKAYLKNIIPEVKKYSEKLDNKTFLTKKEWTLVNEESSISETYIFRPNKQLLVSKTGIVEKGSYDLIDSKTILLDFGGQSFLFKHTFLDDAFLILKLKGTEKYLFFINETVQNEYGISSHILFLSLILKKYQIDIPHTQKKEMLSTNKSIEFNVKKKFNLMFGTHYEYHIALSNGKTGLIYSNKKKDKFFIFNNYTKYFYKDKKSTIEALRIVERENKISKKNLVHTEHA